MKLNKNQKLVLLGLTIFGAYRLNNHLKQKQKIKLANEEHLKNIALMKDNRSKQPGYYAPRPDEMVFFKGVPIKQK